MADETEQQTDTTAAETSSETTTEAADATSTETGAETGDKSLMGGATAELKAEDKTKETTEEAEAVTEGPPEKYELVAPEGFEITADLSAEVDPIFRELGLTNEQANKLMPAAASFATKLQASQLAAHEAMGADWAKKAQADKEIGGKNWAQTESLVARALDMFGAPADSDFRKLLDDTKLGNHPEMIRMFRKIGEAISEDGEFVRSDAGAAIKPDRLASLYPDDVPKTEKA